MSNPSPKMSNAKMSNRMLAQLVTFQVDPQGIVLISARLDILALDILGLDILGLDILRLDILGRSRID